MVTWVELVSEELSRLHEETGRRRVELAEVYDYTLERADREFENNHPRAKVRQTLQTLRDNGELEFLGDGVYHLSDDVVGVESGFSSDSVEEETSILDELESEFQHLKNSE